MGRGRAVFARPSARAGGAGGALVDPPLLAVAEEVVAEPLQRLLEVLRDQLAAGAREPLLPRHRAADVGGREELDALHLVERREVRRVDLVAAVHVARAEERLLAVAQQLRLVRRRVRPQQHVGRRRDLAAAGARDVVRVRRQPPRVVLRDEEVVEARLRLHERVEVVDDLERRPVEALEVLLDLRLDDAERVRLGAVEPAAHQVLDVRRDVVAHVVRDVLRRRRRRLRRDLRRAAERRRASSAY